MKPCLGLLSLVTSLVSFVQGEIYYEPLDGYYFRGLVQSVGGDIVRLADTPLSDRKAYCDSDPDCVAFDMNGYMKSSLQPYSSWQDNIYPFYGMYIKNSAKVPPTEVINGYEVYQGVDFWGDNVLANHPEDLNAMMDLCDAHQSCKAFDVLGNFKYDVVEQQYWEFLGVGNTAVSLYFRGEYNYTQFS